MRIQMKKSFASPAVAGAPCPGLPSSAGTLSPSPQETLTRCSPKVAGCRSTLGCRITSNDNETLLIIDPAGMESERVNCRRARFRLPLPAVPALKKLALSADVLVTSGGVSVGPHDLVRRLELELGVSEVFWGVAMRPGKPLAFGVRGSTLVFGLPGNPVSSLVGCELFVLPAIRALQGAASPEPRFERGTLGEPLRRSPARDNLVRARIDLSADDAAVLRPVVGQESHMIARTATADALIHVPRGEGAIAAGASVRYLRLA